MNEWIKCICNEILFSHKKEENSAIWNNKNGPWGLYAKWNKLEKENHCISTLSCGIWKKKNKLMGTENRLMVARVKGGKGRGLLWVKVVKRYKLPIIR